MPVLVDIGIAFTDMGRNLKVTGFTTENFTRMLGGDSRLSGIMVVTLTYVLCTLAIFNVGYGLLLALLTTALPDRAGALLPRRLDPAADEPVRGLCAAVELGRRADRLRAAEPGPRRDWACRRSISRATRRCSS